MSRAIGLFILLIVMVILLTSCSQADKTQAAFNSWVRGCTRTDVTYEVKTENGRTKFSSECTMSK